MKQMLVILALVLASSPALAQSWAESYCPRGLKYAAGTCVRACPGGYEDRGRVCIKRNEGT
jgi:hypothetical protein